MTNTDIIRQRIYSAYSSNLDNICRIKKLQVGYQDEEDKFIEVKQPYICPICELLFQNGSLDQNSPNPLTLEDVPPKKLGGTKLDSKLIWDLEIQPFIKREPKSRIKAYYEINKSSKKFQFDIVSYQTLDVLKDEKYTFAYNEIWDYYQNDYEC